MSANVSALLANQLMQYTVCRSPTGTFNENEEAERKMGENLSEINQGPLLKKQRWREKKDHNWNPTQRASLFFTLSMAELLYSLTFWCCARQWAKKEFCITQVHFPLQSVLSKLSDLTRHIVEMTDAHLQAPDTHFKRELSQKDPNTCADAKKINPKSK